MMAYQYRGGLGAADLNRSPVQMMITSIEDQLSEIRHTVVDSAASRSVSETYAAEVDRRVNEIEQGPVQDLYNGLAAALTAADLDRLKRNVQSVQETVTSLRSQVLGEGSIGGGQAVKKVFVWGGLAIGGAIVAGLLVARYGSTKKRRYRR